MGLVVGAVGGVLLDVEQKIQSESKASAENDLSAQYQKLCKLLQAAVELELTTLPPYLTAYFSIKEGSNADAANLIRSVFMEEMLHLCLAGNVLVSIGGQVRLGKENIPRYPLSLQFDGEGLKNRDFQVTLEKFSPSSILTFRRIELPDYLPPRGLPEFGRDSEKTVELPAYSIGEFYQDIIDRLVALDSAFRAEGRELFSRDISNQITETYFWRGGGKPIAVTDLPSAKEALSVIIDQGEGSSRSLNDGDAIRFDQAPDLSHYFKFTEVYFRRRFRAEDNPLLAPTGEFFPIDYEAVYPVKGNAKQSDYAENSDLADLNRQFNQSYSLMLRQIEEAFAGNPKVLYNAIMNGMHDLTPVARTMAKIKIDPLHSNETGAPSFEWDQPLTSSTTTISA